MSPILFLDFASLRLGSACADGAPPRLGIFLAARHRRSPRAGISISLQGEHLPLRSSLSAIRHAPFFLAPSIHHKRFAVGQEANLRHVLRADASASEFDEFFDGAFGDFETN